MKNIKTFLFLLLNTLLVQNIAIAMELDADYITNIAKTYLEQNLEIPPQGKMRVEIAKVDPRIVIKPCNTPLILNIPENHSGRNVNIKITCQDSPAPWKMFLHAKVTTSLPVLVATKIISKGSTISNGNVAIEYRNKNKIRGEVLTTSEGLIGAKAKRRIAKNSLITSKYICMVCKGDAVSIEVKSKTFMIKSSGIALSLIHI